MQTENSSTNSNSSALQAIRKLGDGRWGEVYEAEVSGVGRAAVKLLSDAMIELENDIEMSYQDFRTEVRI